MRIEAALASFTRDRHVYRQSRGTASNSGIEKAALGGLLRIQRAKTMLLSARDSWVGPATNANQNTRSSN